MFDLSCEEQKHARASKDVQSLDNIATELGMDKIVDPPPLSLFIIPFVKPLAIGLAR